jgi:hypothetical protein
MSNRGHNKNSVNNGHVGHMGKILIIITSLLLLKTVSHKIGFVTLKRTIRAGLNLVDSLARNGTNTRRMRKHITHASVHKRSYLLDHGKLPFMMNHNITIRSRPKD